MSLCIETSEQTSHAISQSDTLAAEVVNHSGVTDRNSTLTLRTEPVTLRAMSNAHKDTLDRLKDKSAMRSLLSIPLHLSPSDCAADCLRGLGGVEQAQAFKARAVEATVASQQAVSLEQRVRSDQKIRGHAGFRTAACAI